MKTAQRPPKSPPAPAPFPPEVGDVPPSATSAFALAPVQSGGPGATDAPASPAPSIAKVNTAYLETLVGYNARRAALAVISLFVPRMAEYGLRPVDFSILSVIRHNPGITSKQLCSTLNLLPPNLVGKIAALDKRGLLLRHPHPSDGRALGLQLTPEGQALMAQAELTAFELEKEAASALSESERHTLLRLLQKVYSSG